MKEIQEILKKIESLKPNEKAVLATVVDVQGSSYRLPGAKMLILENGDTFGTVSGGCLEADVLERAKTVLKSGSSSIFKYDTSDELDSVFSLNMGCRGVIRILLEDITDNPLIPFLKSNNDEQIESVSATLINSEAAKTIGDRTLLNEKSVFHTEFAAEETETIVNEAKKIFIKKNPYSKQFGFGEVFFDFIAKPLEINVFGAGADVFPLVEIANNMGWKVSIVDHREKFANSERFPNADQIVISRPEKFDVNTTPNSIFVLMTHNYQHDKTLLSKLLKSDARYIGMLGPKARAKNMLDEFENEGLKFTDTEREKMFSPIGLDLGADTPEAIALSIVAEIQSVLNYRNGGNLRDRKGSIYGRNE